LDEIRPREWPAQFTEELLELLWVIEHTVNMSADLTTFLEAVLQSNVLAAEDLPRPTEEQRRAPEIPRGNATIPSEQMTLEEQ
jgi:hypothetical protein